MLKSLSTSLIIRGLLAIGIGVVALAWPGVTVLALVVLFAVYAFIAAGLQALQAFSSRTAWPVFGHLLLGLVNIVAGVIALAWPVPTALVLVLIVATWAIVTGALEVFAAFRSGEQPGTRAMFVLGGLVSTVFGLVLFARPDMGAISLALLFGLFNLVTGSWMLVRGLELRRAHATLHSLARPTRTKVAA
ncbi:MAG TPA: HdeD family acid-resistance protein [Acidimicrobiales bacterium]|nr:HdeD family acid-resistance protein [Acidimicrobiales bacterium]